MESGELKILFLGDIVGRVGRRAVREQLPLLKEKHSPSVVIANGENSAGGFGIQPDTADEIFKAGVDLITTGNHVWSKREIYPYLDKHRDTILRPLNFPAGAPGSGQLLWTHASGVKLRVVNLIGRVFMPDLVDCPFQSVRLLFPDWAKEPAITFVDFHAEATSEKVAMGYLLDGHASVMVGTHTHVQTADERVLQGGTAYISDVGMCGPENGVIGCEREPIVEKFITGRPQRFDVAPGPGIVNGVLATVDTESRKAKTIERIFLRVK